MWPINFTSRAFNNPRTVKEKWTIYVRHEPASIYLSQENLNNVSVLWHFTLTYASKLCEILPFMKITSLKCVSAVIMHGACVWWAGCIGVPALGHCSDNQQCCHLVLTGQSWGFCRRIFCDTIKPHTCVCLQINPRVGRPCYPATCLHVFGQTCEYVNTEHKVLNLRWSTR